MSAQEAREVIADHLFRTQTVEMGQDYALYETVEDALGDADAILAALEDAGIYVGRLGPVSTNDLRERQLGRPYLFRKPEDG